MLSALIIPKRDIKLTILTSFKANTASLVVSLLRNYLRANRYPIRMINTSTYLKLDLYDKKQPTNKLNIRILSETSILYLIRHASPILIVTTQIEYTGFRHDFCL